MRFKLDAPREGRDRSPSPTQEQPFFVRILRQHPVAAVMGIGLAVVLVLGLLLAFLGGSSGRTGTKGEAAQAHLANIRTAYTEACQRLNRPPRSLKELQPFLAETVGPDEEQAEDVLRSPNDDQEFVIHWNVWVPPDDEFETDYVLAYERSGIDGKRYVVTIAAPSCT